MRSTHAVRFLALLLGVAACSHRQSTASEEVPPPAAMPRPAVTAEDIERNPSKPIEQVLMDKFPGVIVARTNDGGLSIRIRGVGSFHEGNEPLYVIDDVPMQAAAGGALKGINPHDIELIQVLKDPSETAIWGARGSNGVIVVRTKRPGH